MTARQLAASMLQYWANFACTETPLPRPDSHNGRFWGAAATRCSR